MPTPHIEAPDGAFAPIVLMPGDPRRAAYIAEHHLDAPELVTNVRNISGFTGSFQGTPISVMASGMGIPSAAIYITELFRSYEVDTIIRIGTAGAYQPELNVRQLVAATDAVTNSALPELIAGGPTPMVADPGLLTTAGTVASAQGVSLETGTVFTSDVFYEPNDAARDTHTAAGVLCVEMETAGLYAIAGLEVKRALSLLTMSDHLVTGERMSSQERQDSLDEMIQLALQISVA